MKIIDALMMLIVVMGWPRYPALFWLKRQPVHCIWILATHYPSDNQRCIAKDHWRSVDTHCQKGALNLPHIFLPIKAAKRWVIDNTNHVTFQLHYLHDQKLFTACWRSFSWWGREHLVFHVFYKGGQYTIYDSLQQFTTQITNDAKPRFIDAPLTLIVMMEQGACRYHFSL